MLRAGQSLPPTGLSTLRFDAGRFPPTPAACYWPSWQLPRPDSHRPASTGLRVGLSCPPPPLTTRCPTLLGTRKRKLAKADRGTGAARGRRVLILAVSPLERGLCCPSTPRPCSPSTHEATPTS